VGWPPTCCRHYWVRNPVHFPCGTCCSYKCDFVLFQHQIPHTKAQVLSRRVWDILTLLPTSPILLQGFQQLENSENISLQQLLDPASPQKLMYSLYIVESLSRPNASVKKNKSSVCSVSLYKYTEVFNALNRYWSLILRVCFS